MSVIDLIMNSKLLTSLWMHLLYSKPIILMTLGHLFATGLVGVSELWVILFAKLSTSDVNLPRLVLGATKPRASGDFVSSNVYCHPHNYLKVLMPIEHFSRK